MMQSYHSINLCSSRLGDDKLDRSCLVRLHFGRVHVDAQTIVTDNVVILAVRYQDGSIGVESGSVGTSKNLI